MGHNRETVLIYKRTGGNLQINFRLTELSSTAIDEDQEEVVMETLIKTKKLYNEIQPDKIA